MVDHTLTLKDLIMKTKILAKAAGFVILSGWFSAFIGAVLAAPTDAIGAFWIDFLVIWGAVLSIKLGIELLTYAP